MENIAINKLMKLINALSLESRLEVFSKLSESLKFNSNPKEDSKENLLDELFGSWKSVNNDSIDNIIKDRSVSDKDLSFD